MTVQADLVDDAKHTVAGFIATIIPPAVIDPSAITPADLIANLQSAIFHDRNLKLKIPAKTENPNDNKPSLKWINPREKGTFHAVPGYSVENLWSVMLNTSAQELVTVAIASRNRPHALKHCLASLRHIQNCLREVIVLDDGSEAPLEGAPALDLDAISKDLRSKFRFIRRGISQGYIVARNEMVRASTTEWVLILDDDAYFLENNSFEKAISLISADRNVAVVALGCSDSEGKTLPPYLQPSRAEYPCLVNSHIGYAHLLRRSIFLNLHGYKELFEAYGEEKEFCLRAWDADYKIVYLPDVQVVHTHDLTGRDHKRGRQLQTRNAMCASLLNEPWPLPILTIPVHLKRLAVNCEAVANDRAGLAHVLWDFTRAVPALLRKRRAVSWRTIREWRSRARKIPAYHGSLSAYAEPKI